MNILKKLNINTYNQLLIVFMVISVAFFSTAVLLNSKANFTFTPTGFTNSVGGTGGTETGLQDCPIGTIAIGMEGRVVTDVNAVREGYNYLSDYATRCGTITIDYSDNSVETIYNSTTASVSGTIVASRSPLPKIVDCPSTSALGGFSGFQKLNASQNTILVNSLKLRCSVLTTDPVTKLIVAGPKTDGSTEYIVNEPEVGATPIANADCPDNSVVTGFQGRVGELFDLFKLACGTIDQASLTVSVIGPDYANYVVDIVDANSPNFFDTTHKETILLAPSKYYLVLKNTVTNEIFENFICDKILKEDLKKYEIMLAKNTSNFCTIDVTKVIVPVDPIKPDLPPNPPTLPSIPPVPVVDKIIPLSPTVTPVPVINTVAVPSVQVTVRTGGIYISIISILIMCVVGVLLFFKLKR